jgi:Fe-S cluster biosynthesis and repair protein YggX
MPEADPNRLVDCVKLGKQLPGLAKPPFPTPFGQEIYERVSKEAWDLWLKESVRYINTYRVDLSTKDGMEFMMKQLRIWLNMEEGDLAATAWTPEQGDKKDEG